MNNLRNAITAICLLPALAGAGDMSGNEERLMPQWQKLDKNGDGLVAISELHPMQASVMVRSDFDGDGTISLQEYVAYDLDPGGAGRQVLAENIRVIRDLPYAATDDPR